MKPEKVYLLFGIYWNHPYIMTEFKKVEPKKEFSKPRKDIIRQRCQIFKEGESTFSAGVSPGRCRKSGAQVRGSTTSKMWSVLSATKWVFIMTINALNVRKSWQRIDENVQN